MRHFFIGLLFLSLFTLQVSAQEDSAATDKPIKRPWLLTMGMDIKMRSIKGAYSYKYEGEYVDLNHQNAEVIWNKKSEKFSDLLEFGAFTDIKMDVMVSHNRSTKFGLSYNFGIINYTSAAAANSGYYGYDHSYPFLAITGIFDQSWYFANNRFENGDPFLYGSLAAGFYRGNWENSGPGQEYFSEARIGAGYHFTKKNWIPRIWLAQNFMFYRENEQSPIFNRTQHVKTDMNLLYMGIGIYKQFELIPD